MPPPPIHKNTKKPSDSNRNHKFTGKNLAFYSSSTQPNNIAITFTPPAAADNDTQHSLDACPDPNRSKKDKAAALYEVEDYCLDPSPNSFSQALQECQNRRIKSKPHSYIERQINCSTSIDLNGATISPRFLVETLSNMKKNPNFKYPTKGWSSERVAMPTHSSRRYPFNNRAIPSKWEDAEKWIFSPVNSDNAGRLSVPPPHHRRPKSKSGPLGPPAYMMMSSSVVGSPLNPGFDSGRVGGFGGGSPFLGGNFGMEPRDCGDREGGRRSGAGEGGCGRSSSVKAEPYILRTSSVHGWSDAMVESCSSQDEKVNNNRETSTMTSSSILTKDVATQMSSDSSTQSSPKARHSSSKSQSSHPIEELEHFSKLEVRDVEVDDRVTVTRWSKKHVARGSDKRPMNILEWKKKIVESRADSISTPKVSEVAKNISRSKREEANITAWENLQKAKAEAAIRKLEMKLEKKKATSMDKIMKNLGRAQKKAGDMRSAAATNQSQSIENKNSRSLLYFCKAKKIGALGSCFKCPAY